jgi:polyisoprenoid-binding protein YceI
MKLPEATMAKWFLETGHTAAEFSARHMMVTNVRGHFRDVHGHVELDEAHPLGATVDVTIDARNLCTGQPQRDAHLRSPDFLDVERFPEIRYRGRVVQLVSAHDWLVDGELTIRGVTRPERLRVRYLGAWSTPWWDGNVNLGPKRRAGFQAVGRINRHDFGVSWNSPLDQGGVVVSDEVELTIDAEAVLGEPPPGAGY